jgi:methyl-accepting chemotaxis protein
MRFILSPAIYLMNSMRLPAKFALIGAIFAIELIYFGYQNIGELNARLNQLKAEQAGAAIIKDLVQWNKVLIDYRQIAITARDGDQGVRDLLKPQAAQCDKVLAQLKEDAGRYPSLVKTDATLKEMQGGWQELQSKVQGLPVDKDFRQKAFAAHGKEFDRIYAFMRDLGDQTGMSLEPDIDTFYLGFPLANNTPKVAGITVRIMAYQTLNLARGTLTTPDKIFYEVTEARLKDAFGGVDTMLHQSMKGNALAKERLEKPLSDFKAQISSFLEFSRNNFITPDHSAVTQQQINEAAQGPIAAAWKLVEANLSTFQQLLDERTTATRTKLTFLGAAILAGITLSVYLFAGLYLALTASFQKCIEAAREIADGDLTTELNIEAKDETVELMQALQKMIRSMRETVGLLVRASSEVSSSASELHMASEQMAGGVGQVVSQAHTVATAGEEMAATSGEIAQNCHLAAGSANAANAAALEGAKVVKDTVGVMESIAVRVRSAAANVSSLGSRSDQIGEIIGTIEDIADQTNLLALNAAIEAARAGEQGRGFAVVADEVRALAVRTTKATKEIGDMIKTIQLETGKAVGAMESGVREVEKGTDEASKSGLALEAILVQINAVTQQTQQIATAAEEQTATTSEISNNMQMITDTVQESARGAQEVTRAAGRLSEISEELGLVVGRFRL